MALELAFNVVHRAAAAGAEVEPARHAGVSWCFTSVARKDLPVSAFSPTALAGVSIAAFWDVVGVGGRCLCSLSFDSLLVGF
eukprot:CAMPEP_0206589280 /NCGR_PEP_ID=MMETSP0325_2-20121206/38815_1 /ASSEMBLY_ACC=CAM_ASM_000347 /TAXON_ID=2866 /ORGANISM="Crypthecodinium cohnii, Strain Seligo" /LENGTH=81 /DNA_ID=CAMNT_0054097781 /DNA_START=462 /DNA_END=707 /DNA_ORIENTATION=+